MAVYIGLLVIALAIAIMANQNHNRQKGWGEFYAILLIIVSSFRYDVGMDYLAYEEMFNLITIGQEQDVSELGFVLLCKMCAIISGSAQMMFMVCAIFTILLLYKSFRLFSPNIVMSLFFFMCMGQLYLTTFNAVRQYIAIAIFTYSIKFILEKKVMKYVLSILVATLFHNTAIILLPLYYLLPKKISKVVMISFGVLLTSSIGIITDIILNSPYAIYLEFEHYAKEVSIIDYLYIMFGLLIIVFESKLMRQYKDRNIFFNINFLCTSLFFLNIVFSGTPIIMVTTRLNYYFIVFYAIIFVRLIKDIRLPSNRIIFELGFYLILAVLFIRSSILKGESYNLLPYNINLHIIDFISI